MMHLRSLIYCLSANRAQVLTWSQSAETVKTNYQETFSKPLYIIAWTLCKYGGTVIFFFSVTFSGRPRRDDAGILPFPHHLGLPRVSSGEGMLAGLCCFYEQSHQGTQNFLGIGHTS